MVIEKLISAAIRPHLLPRWLAVTFVLGLTRVLYAAPNFEQVDGPYDGHVTSYVRDSGSGNIYATGMGLGLGGGVFVSTDNGESWHRVAGNNQLGEAAVNAPRQFGIFQENIGLPSVSGLQASNLRLGIDPSTTPNTLYVAFFYPGVAGKVFRSIDAGANWTDFSTGLTGVSPYEFARAPNGDMFLAGLGGSGLFRLPAGGSTWLALNTGTNNARAVAVDQVNGDIYFTNLQNSIDANKPAVFRSADNGDNFIGVPITTSIVGGGAADAGSYNRLLNAIAIDNTVSPPVIHVAVKDRWQWLTQTQIATGGHFRSTDYGANWVSSGTALNVESMTVDATGRVFLGVGNNTTYYGAVWRSTNRGQSFAKIDHPGINDAATIVGLKAVDADTIFAGADGPYRSTDGGLTWTHLDNRGMKSNRRITEVAIDTDGTIYCASNQHGVSRSLDGGATWTAANGAGASRIGSLFINTIAVDPSTHYVYAGSGLGQSAARMYRSADKGATWNQVAGFTAQYQAMDIAFAQNGNVIFGGLFGGPGGVFYSIDNGISSVSSANPIANQPVYSLAVNPVSGHIYAGTETDATWLSIDHGVSFTQLSWTTAIYNGCSGQAGNKGNIFGIAVSNDGGTIYEAALRGLFKSTDNGSSWQQVNVPGAGGCGQVGLGVFVDPNGYIYYLFTETTPAGPKLKRSTDGGTNWEQFNAGLPIDSRGGYGTHAMAFNPIDGKLYMGVSWATVSIKQGTSGLFRTVDAVYTPAATASPSPTFTPPVTATASPSSTFTHSIAATATITPTPTPTSPPTPTPTEVPSSTPMPTPTALETPATGCPEIPDTMCLSAGKGSVAVKNDSDGRRQRFSWQWGRGALAASQGDFGDPVNGSPEYKLCLYDQTGGASALKMELSLAAGGTCGNKPCWKAVSDKGWSYWSKDGIADGITKVKFKGGAPGKPSLQVIGGGASLPLPMSLSNTEFFDQDNEVIVQFHASGTARCWSSSFAAVATRKNNGVRFRARTP